MNKRKSATVVKSYLESPFNPTWPVVEQEHQAKIRVILGKVPPRKQQSRKRKRTEETQLNHKSDSKIVGTPKRVKPYVSGVNEVTKALEKDRLSVVFICRSVKPQTLVEHLLPLAHVNKTKICAMYDLSILLGNLVGTKMCTVFTEDTYHFVSTIARPLEFSNSQRCHPKKKKVCQKTKVHNATLIVILKSIFASRSQGITVVCVGACPRHKHPMVGEERRELAASLSTSYNT
eukprot:m.119643 g.119643  ORF g.119643 m.119643 type:complete len:233 (+) comp14325_c0_seq8:233-931(+)